MPDELYCICRSKSSKGFMIACDRCNEWFHGKCISITKSFSSVIDKYYCDACRAKNVNLEIVYKPHYHPDKDKNDVTTKQEPLEERHHERKILEKKQSTSSKAEIKSETKARSKQSTAKVAQGRRAINQKAKSKTHNRKQCANPECVFEARTDSKYCSDDCGYAFNKLRYDHHFIPKWKALEEKHSQARLKKMQDLNQLERDKVDVEVLIKNLRVEREELEQNIKIIKDQAKRLRNENENSKENEDDDGDQDSDDVEEIASGDAAKTFCVICGLAIKFVDTFKHWTLCHKKHEAMINYTADVLAVNYPCDEDKNPSLYCHQQDKKTKRYCMHLMSACPLHSSWQTDKDEVCGCPTKIMQRLEPTGQYCLELKKDCQQHYHWEKFRLAQLDMQRVQAFSKRDCIIDRMKMVDHNLKDTYGGIVGVMLHNTINHRSEQDSPANNLNFEQEDIDVEMAES